mmetsp:Transcript_42359/g.137833  ORF Transcript_42359/g.137833 Transcript_42359/m.137833 type:complete len:202 (+) Transcript_42359:518-1123(+)
MRARRDACCVFDCVICGVEGQAQASGSRVQAGWGGGARSADPCGVSLIFPWHSAACISSRGHARKTQPVTRENGAPQRSGARAGADATVRRLCASKYGPSRFRMRHTKSHCWVCNVNVHSEVAGGRGSLLNVALFDEAVPRPEALLPAVRVGPVPLAGEEPVVQVHPHAGYRQAAADDSEGRERCERHSLPVRVPRKRGSD